MIQIWGPAARAVGLDLQVDRFIQSRLRDVFAANFEPDISANHVDGVQDAKGPSTILSELGVSVQELKQTLYSRNYPRVEQTRICCPNGRHRIETAIEAYCLELCWTVQPYCIPDSFTGGAHRVVLQGLYKRYSPQFAHFGGEGFCNARRHHTNEKQVQRWSLKLILCKRVSLCMLLGDKSRMKMYRQISGATAPATFLEAFEVLVISRPTKLLWSKVVKASSIPLYRPSPFRSRGSRWC